MHPCLKVQCNGMNNTQVISAQTDRQNRFYIIDNGNIKVKKGSGGNVTK